MGKCHKCGAQGSCDHRIVKEPKPMEPKESLNVPLKKAVKKDK